MFQFKLVFLSIFTLSLFQTMTFAATVAKTKKSVGKDFIERVLKESEGCSSLYECDENWKLKRAPLNTTIDPKVQSLIDQAVLDLAGTWNDTILEGEYGCDTSTARVSEIEAIVNRSGKIEGYYVTFSAPAWYTGSCDPNYDAETEEEIYEGCDQTNISESAFISADGTAYASDPNAYPEDDL